MPERRKVMSAMLTMLTKRALNPADMTLLYEQYVQSKRNMTLVFIRDSVFIGKLLTN
jgi:hypothetical protein